MGAPKAQKSKEPKMMAAMAGATKGKMGEKLMNEVMWTKALQDKLVKEVPKAKLITPAIITERLKVNCSLARQGIQYLEEKGLIQVVGDPSSKALIYTRKIA